MSETPDLVFPESEELFTTQDLVNENEKQSENITESEEVIPSSEVIEDEPMEEDVADEEEEILDGMDDDKENDRENTEGASGTSTEKTNEKKKPSSDRISTLPLAKIKHIIKLDPEVQLVSNEAIYLITKATENFIKSLAKESATLAFQQKKKTIGKSHVDFALTMLPVEL